MKQTFRVGQMVRLTKKYLDSEEETSPLECMINAGTNQKYEVHSIGNHYNGEVGCPLIKIVIDGKDHGNWYVNTRCVQLPAKPVIVIMEK